jgi:hypothetical protein
MQMAEKIYLYPIVVYIHYNEQETENIIATLHNCNIKYERPEILLIIRMQIFSYQYGVVSIAPITCNYNQIYIVDFILQIGMGIRTGCELKENL